MLLRENTKKKKKNPTAVIEVVLLDFFAIYPKNPSCFIIFCLSLSHD